jgi:hypothetical protein
MEETTAKPAQTGFRIPNWLVKGYLILATAISIFVAVLHFYEYRDLVTHSDPTVPHWPSLVFALTSLVAIVFFAALWFDKRWGLIGYVALVIINILINLYLQVPISEIARGMGGFAIFVFIFSTRFRQLKMT